MREILFRAKRVDNGEWVEGYYAVKGKGTDLEKHFIVTSIFDSNTNAYPFYFTDNWVQPETVCQYTGLTDGDGRKIYEGDIVYIHSSCIDEEDGGFSVEWDEDAARFDLCGEGLTVDFDSFYGRECEVVGNRFDNPDLKNEYL